jgi:hypothetical protein
MIGEQTHAHRQVRAKLPSEWFSRTSGAPFCAGMEPVVPFVPHCTTGYLLTGLRPFD